MIRPPAVANQFYDGDPNRLRRQLDYLVPSRSQVEKVIAIISPHAGYIYSGHIAGAVYAQITVPDTVIILGPSHTGLGVPGSVMSHGSWSTPLGMVPINEKLATDIISSCPLLEEDIQAHLYEHSLEVQLPFLQYRNPDISIVPICLAGFDYSQCKQIGTSIANTIETYNKPTLIVASSDMTHYESQESAETKDKMAIEQILKLDPEALLTTTIKNNITMCGVIPVTITLIAALQLGAKEAKLVKYATSGDINGDYSHVVGYAGIIIK